MMIEGMLPESHTTIDVAPYDANPGYTGDESISILDFKRDGRPGVDTGMTKQDCVRIGRSSDFQYVGHRNANESCFRYMKKDSGTTDAQFNQVMSAPPNYDTTGKIHMTIDVGQNVNVEGNERKTETSWYSCNSGSTPACRNDLGRDHSEVGDANSNFCKPGMAVYC